MTTDHLQMTYFNGATVRDIPARADLAGYLLAYIDAAGLRSAPPESPLFRRVARKTSILTTRAMTADDRGRMLKRRMAHIRLPQELSSHSFRVGAITDLLSSRMDVARCGSEAETRHWKCRVRVKLHRGFESLPLRFLCNQLDLRHQVYKVPHLDE